MKAAFFEVKAFAPALSLRKLPKVAMLLSIAVVACLGLSHIATDEMIVDAVPCKNTVGGWITEMGSLTETTVLHELGDIKGCYWLNDHGNKAGRDMLVQLFSWWDPVRKCVMVRFADNAIAGKSSEEVAANLLQVMRRMGISVLLGTITDNAANALSGLVGVLRNTYPRCHAMGCWLHVMNLVLMAAYYKAFGDEERGVNSALRNAYVTPYLLDRYFKDYTRWGAEKGLGKVHHVAQGTANRWWSIIAGFGDIIRDHAQLLAFFRYMHTRCESDTYRAMFQDSVMWLSNNKMMLDMKFVHAWCIEFWQPYMKYIMDIDELQRKQSETGKQHHSFRAQRLPRMVVRMHRHAEAMKAKLLSHDSFSGIRQELETALTAQEEGWTKESFETQVEVFLHSVHNTVRVHAERILTLFVDCALADFACVARPVAAALLAIYDDEECPEIDPTDTFTLDNCQFHTAEFVKDVVQFATADGLRKRSMLFTDPAHVHLIREVLKHDWDFEAAGVAGEALMAVFHHLIHPLCISNILSEHGVQQAGNQAGAKYAKGLSQDKIGACHFSLANCTTLEDMAAFDEYVASGLQESRSSPASKSFRSMGKKVRVLGGGCNVAVGGVVCDPYS